MYSTEPGPRHCADGLTPDHEFSGLLESFIATNFEHDPSLTNLADLVAWNQANPDLAMPERKSALIDLLISGSLANSVLPSIFWPD